MVRSVRSLIPDGAFLPYSTTLGTAKNALADRRIGENPVRLVALGDDVGPLLHRHVDHRGHRLDAGHVDLVQLLDEAEDGVELAAKRLRLGVAHRDPRQPRDLHHRVLVDCHRRLVTSPSPARAAYSIGGNVESTRSAYRNNSKRVYYFSVEFLIGRLLRDAMSNLGLVAPITEALRELGRLLRRD